MAVAVAMKLKKNGFVNACSQSECLHSS